MKPSDEAIKKSCESLAPTIGPEALRDMAVEVRIIANRYLRESDQRKQDAEAAQKLHLGWRVVSELQGCCKSAVYKKAHRHAVHGKPATVD